MRGIWQRQSVTRQTSHMDNHADKQVSVDVVVHADRRPVAETGKHRTNHCTRSSFFYERIINVWNIHFRVVSTVNFSSVNSFKQSIGSVDFTVFLKCS